jgi:hypothetical protein
MPYRLSVPRVTPRRLTVTPNVGACLSCITIDGKDYSYCDAGNSGEDHGHYNGGLLVRAGSLHDHH